MYDAPATADTNSATYDWIEAAGITRKHIDELENRITLTAGQLNALDYRFIKLLSEFDEVEGWAGDGIKSFAHWLNWKCGLNSLVAREKVRVARALRELPQIDQAFELGEMSYSKVRAMTRVATPRNESYLLEIARQGTTQHVELLVRRFKRCKDLERMDRMDEWKLDASFDFYQDETGMYVFRGRLPAEDGEVIAVAIEQMKARMKQDRGETEECGLQPENVSAETFSDAGFTEDFLHHSAAAITRIAEHFIATASEEPQPFPAAEKYHVLLHINANDASLAHRIDDRPVCYLESGRFLAPQVARKLACDAVHTTVLEDDAGTVLNIGRKSRTIPRKIALALKVRDQGCRFPSCHQQKWTDAHHIHHWADGGETSLDNLVTLCRHHHTLLHKDLYRIERREGGLVFINRDGAEIKRALVPQFPPAPPPEFPAHIDHNTAVPGWFGESMDYDMAIAALYEA